MLEKFIFKLKLIFLPCQNNNYKPKFLEGKFLFYYVVFLLLLKIIVIPFLFYFPKTVFFADITKTDLVQLTNLTREHFGFQPLRENFSLNQAAYLKAKDMMEGDYFAHYSPEGLSPWYWLVNSGYQYSFAGENLAIGFLESEQVHQAWMNSFSHKKNILNPDYQEIGIAVLTGDFHGKETTLVVQYFGSRKAVVSFAQEERPLTVLPAEKDILPSEEITEIKEQKQEEKDSKKEVLVAQEEIPFSPEEVDNGLAGNDKDFPKSSAFLFFRFMTSNYYDLLQKIVYGSLVLIIISLFVTVYCDIFIYRKFEIDYKDVILKAFSFLILWLSLLYLDKMIILQIITQNFRID